MSFNQWFVNPIYCFKPEGALPNFIDNNAFINALYRTSEVKNVYLYACAFFIDTLKLKYDANTEYVNSLASNSYGIKFYFLMNIYT